MHRKFVLIGLAGIIALLASTFALNLTPTASAATKACSQIFGPKQSSILLGKTQSVGQDIDVSKFKTIQVKIRSAKDSPTRVRTEFRFNDKNKTVELAYVFAGETAEKTFSIHDAKMLDVQAYAYTEGDRKAHDNIWVTIQGCK